MLAVCGVALVLGCMFICAEDRIQKEAESRIENQFLYSYHKKLGIESELESLLLFLGFEEDKTRLEFTSVAATRKVNKIFNSSSNSQSDQEIEIDERQESIQIGQFVHKKISLGSVTHINSNENGRIRIVVAYNSPVEKIGERDKLYFISDSQSKGVLTTAVRPEVADSVDQKNCGFELDNHNVILGVLVVLDVVNQGDIAVG